MIKKLAKEQLKADIFTAQAMLYEAQSEDDAVGQAQFTDRVEALRVALAELDDVQGDRAAVALFFGGRPVTGSRGVDAEFASDAVKSFQDLVSKHFSSLEMGGLGARGPVPVSDEAKLMVTDIVRGSFGFVLEESPEQGQLVETQLADALEQASSVLSRLSSSNDDWADAVEEMDSRVIAAVNDFVSILDEAGATVRIVERDHDRLLSRDEIHRARERTDRATITEEDIGPFVGRLIGATSKTFEFSSDEIGAPVAGKIAPLQAAQIKAAGENHEIQRVLFTPIRAWFKARHFQSATSSRTYYILTRVDDRSTE